jgi:hypothetical protein
LPHQGASFIVQSKTTEERKRAMTMILPDRIEFNPQRDLLGRVSERGCRNTGKGRLARPAGAWA